MCPHSEVPLTQRLCLYPNCNCLMFPLEILIHSNYICGISDIKFIRSIYIYSGFFPANQLSPNLSLAIFVLPFLMNYTYNRMDDKQGRNGNRQNYYMRVKISNLQKGKQYEKEILPKQEKICISLFRYRSNDTCRNIHIHQPKESG